MSEARPSVRRGTASAERIPVTWFAPASTTGRSKLVVWLAPGVSGIEAGEPVLERLVRVG